MRCWTPASCRTPPARCARAAPRTLARRARAFPTKCVRTSRAFKLTRQLWVAAGHRGRSHLLAAGPVAVQFPGPGAAEPAAMPRHCCQVACEAAVKDNFLMVFGEVRRQGGEVGDERLRGKQQTRLANKWAWCPEADLHPMAQLLWTRQPEHAAHGRSQVPGARLPTPPARGCRRRRRAAAYSQQHAR
jgi:hypothetical protein